MSAKANPSKLNSLQLKTLVILQELARGDEAREVLEDGGVALSGLPHPHGDHFHVGNAVVRAKDATGLGNPAVFGALQRKGLISQALDGRLVVTPVALAYETGIAGAVLYHADH